MLAGHIFTSSELWTNFDILCDEMGSRFAGTPQEEEAARFLESKLREYGLDNVHNEAFEYHGWTRGGARLAVTSDRPAELDWSIHADVACWLRARTGSSISDPALPKPSMP